MEDCQHESCEGMVALHLENPYVGVALNPAKGHTVKTFEVECAFEWNSTYNNFALARGKDTEIFEVSVSDFTYSGDLLPMLEGLLLYSYSKLQPSYIGDHFKFSIPGYHIKGGVDGESLSIRDIDDGSVFLTDIIEAEAYKKGVRRVIIPLALTDSRIIEYLTGHYGYKPNPTGVDLESGCEYQILMKELECPEEEIASGVKLEWQSEPMRFNLSSLIAEWNVALRDENSKILGIVHGEILNGEEVQTPHAHIDNFFINELVRGAGFGKALMNEAEEYIRSRGLDMIQLETADHEAPWFYEKIGYERRESDTLHNVGKDNRGKILSSYSYVKKL